MSKFLKSMIVLLAIVAMAAPVMAEDMLSLGGQMRVRGWHIDKENKDNTNSWIDQRLRIGGKLSIADGVSITFRTDITESNWGTQGSKYGSGRVGKQQWDRAHIDLAFSDSFSLRAGQQYVWFLKSGAVNTQTNGLKAVIGAGPVAITAFGFMNTDRNTGVLADADGFTFGANGAFGNDTFKINVLAAGQNKTESADEEVFLMGADLTLNLDIVKIVAEVKQFGGDAYVNAAGDTVDAFGTQAYLDVSFGLGEAVTLGGQAFYAAGDKDDEQYTYLGNDFGAYDPLAAYGSGLDDEQINFNRPATFFGYGAGVEALRLYGDFKFGDAITLGASVAYLAASEDDPSVAKAETALHYGAGMKFALMSNASLGVQVEYADYDKVVAGQPESVLGAGVGLFVNF